MFGGRHCVRSCCAYSAQPGLQSLDLMQIVPAVLLLLVDPNRKISNLIQQVAGYANTCFVLALKLSTQVLALCIGRVSLLESMGTLAACLCQLGV